MTLQPTAESDPIGQVIDQKFRVVSRLGSGGLGVVYLARQEGLGRNVAIKFLRPDSAEELKERFRNEAKVLANVSHPNVLAGYAQGTWNSMPFIVCELIEGETLEVIVARRGAVPWQEAFAICAQAALGLHALHSAQIIHRDIKPSNIMTSEGSVKLIDLGLCQAGGADRQKLTVTGSFVGTPHYACPELIMGQPITPAADIYALGCVLFELVTGKRLVDASTIDDALKTHLIGVSQTLAKRCSALPDFAVEVISCALAREPEQRFPSAAEFAESLTKAIEADAAGKRAPGRVTPNSTTKFVGIALIAVMLTVSAFAIWWKSIRNAEHTAPQTLGVAGSNAAQESRALVLARKITPDVTEQTALDFFDAFMATPQPISAEQADTLIDALAIVDPRFGCQPGTDLVEHRKLSQKMMDAGLWPQMLRIDHILINSASKGNWEHEEVSTLLITIERLQGLQRNDLAQELLSKPLNGSLNKQFQRYVRKRPLNAETIVSWLLTLEPDVQSHLVYNICQGTVDLENNNLVQSTTILDEYFRRSKLHSSQLDQARNLLQAYHLCAENTSEASDKALYILQKDLTSEPLTTRHAQPVRAAIERMALICILNSSHDDSAVSALGALIKSISMRDPQSDLLPIVRDCQQLSKQLSQEKCAIEAGDKSRGIAYMDTANKLIDRLPKEGLVNYQFPLTQRIARFIYKNNLKNEATAKLINHYMEMLTWHMYCCNDLKKLEQLLQSYSVACSELKDFLPPGEPRMLRIEHAPLSTRVRYYEMLADFKNRERVILEGLALVKNCTTQAGIAERIDDRVRLQQLWCTYHNPELAQKYHDENAIDIEKNSQVLGHIVPPMKSREAGLDILIRSERAAATTK